MGRVGLGGLSDVSCIACVGLYDAMCSKIDL